MSIQEGDFVRWMLPLDHDYSYGVITGINKNYAIITHTLGYYKGKQTEVHISYIRKGGLRSGNKTKRRRK